MIPSHKRLFLIANPHAGRGRAARIIDDAIRLFRERGIRPALELTHGPNDATRIAAAVCANRAADVIVSIGGDGTMNEIVQAAVFTGMPVAVVPAGSGNDFAKVLNTPRELGAVVDTIVRGAAKTIDAGRMNQRYFANGVGIGFDAAVNYNTRTVRRVKAGLAVYFLAFLKTLNRYKPCRVRIELDGEIIEREMFLVSIGNGTTCGGGFRLTPHALIDDGLLDVTMVDPLAVPVLLRHLPKVFNGTIEKSGRAVMRRTTKLTVVSEHPLPVQVDGEVYALEGGKCEIEVLPGALTVIGNF